MGTRYRRKFYPKGGVKMWGMPIHIRKAIVQINGTEKVESVTMCDITPDGEIVKGSEKRIDVISFVSRVAFIR